MVPTNITADQGGPKFMTPWLMAQDTALSWRREDRNTSTVGFLLQMLWSLVFCLTFQLLGQDSAA